MLLRHACAEPFVGQAGDMDRQLTAEGLRQAARLGRWLLANDLMPSVIYASFAIRVTQTVEQLCTDKQIKLVSDERFFRADSNDWLECIKAINSQEKLPLLIGHNPTIGDLASGLAGKTIHFSTCDLVVLASQSAWSNLANGDCELLSHRSGDD